MTTAARSIGNPVGKHGINRNTDVKVIQDLLNSALEREPRFKATGIERLAADGDCGPMTMAAIVAFQVTVLGWSGAAADGTVHQGRRTWRRLNGNAATASSIAPLTIPRPPTVLGYAAYRQGDFATTKLGAGDLNISGHGCALCTLTMAATMVGSPTSHWDNVVELPADLTPPQANAIVKKAGGFAGSSLYMGKAAEALGMSYDEYGMRPGHWNDRLSPSDLACVESHLLAGHPVAAHVDYKSTAVGDHWILIITRNGNGTFGAIDPATGRAMTLTKSRPPLQPVDDGGILFGHGQGGSPNQQKYVVRRFGLLAPAAGGYCAAVVD